MKPGFGLYSPEWLESYFSVTLSVDCLRLSLVGHIVDMFLALAWILVLWLYG